MTGTRSPEPIYILPDSQQKICLGPFCECAGTEEECACRQIGPQGFDERVKRCSDCGVKFKVIDLETGEDVFHADFS